MLNHHTNQVFIDNLEVTDDDLIGEEGKGFYYLVDSLNSERLLVASEAIGDGKWFTEQSSRYATDRVVFDRQIGANQGIQFPIAKAYMNLQAAELMRNRAARMFDRKLPCGTENQHRQIPGDRGLVGSGGSLHDHVRRLRRRDPNTMSNASGRRRGCFRTAPLSNNLILAQVAERGLGMPRSY